MKFKVHGYMRVSCYTEVEADSAEEALKIATQREVADVMHTEPVGDAWQIDTDGVPDGLTTEG